MAYHLINAPSAPDDIDFDEEVVVTTHPAQPGTYVVYAEADGGFFRFPVILWGVRSDTTLVPITFEGAWDGATYNENKCVLMPDGSCHRFEESWKTLDEALNAIRPAA